MPGTLESKVAIVTGGGSGIGRAASLVYAREGARVVVSDVNSEGSEETVSSIKEAGGDAIFVYADVTKASDMEALVSKTVETFGRLDCAFNNAGISSGLTNPTTLSIIDYPEEAFDTVIAINLKGVWLSMKYQIPQMLEQGGGAIVNTASIYGLVGSSAAGAYHASKHGVVGLTKTAALEYAQQGIRVNAVCPGYIYTPMTSSITSSPESEAEIIARHPIGRMGNPEEIAEAVAWLSSDASSFVTGTAMPVDGGYIAQ